MQTSPSSDGRVLRLKLLGLLCCAGPLGVLLMFALGEGVIGEGIGHVIQALPLAVVLAFAWWRPLAGGALLTIAAAVLGGAYASAGGGTATPWWLQTFLMLFVPVILGGLLFVAAGLVARPPGWLQARRPRDPRPG